MPNAIICTLFYTDWLYFTEFKNIYKCIVFNLNLKKVRVIQILDKKNTMYKENIILSVYKLKNIFPNLSIHIRKLQRPQYI